MRFKRCKKCGKNFENTRRGAYLCLECSAASRKEHYIKNRTCLVCGGAFPGPPAARYCPSCRDDHLRELQSKCKRANTTRPIGSKDICIRCGAQYIVTGSSQKWCKSCAAEGRKEAQHAYARAYRAAHKAHIAAYAAAMRVDNKSCVICGRAFGGRGPAVTCSDACAREQLHRRRMKARLKKASTPEEKEAKH